MFIQPLQKQTSARGLIFLIYSSTHPLFSNKFEVKLASAQKHLELNLDSKLPFSERIADKINKAMKSNGLLHKLQFILPRSSLLTI